MNEQQSQVEAESRLKDEPTSMDSIWTEAEKQFEEICGTALKREDAEVKNFENLQKKIEDSCDAAADSNQKPDTKWDLAKRVGLESLQWLKVFVGAAADASNMLPIPPVAANLARSALCFVFDIPQKIKDYHDFINQIFGEVASTLSQFRIYKSMEVVDPFLITQINLVLASFVKICAHVVEHRQSRKRDRTINFIRGAPSKLSLELSTFKKLLQAQRDVEGTLTFAKVATIEMRTDAIHDKVQEAQKDLRSLGSDATRLKSLATIRDTFGISTAMSLDASTTPTCTDLANKCADKTGTWIWDHNAYVTWKAPKDKTVLVLSGPQSSGKTSACALITKRLEEHKAGTHVASYFFPTSARKSEENSNPVQVAIKQMAFQIARVDATVQKALGKACSEKPSSFRQSASSGLSKLWKEMQIGASGSTATYYFVFDGLDNLPREQAELLIAFVVELQRDQQPAKGVRILLSGTPNLFISHPDLSGELWIRMEEHNHQDMRIKIQGELSSYGILQNTKSNSQQRKVKDMILNKLPNKTEGSYSSLTLELGKVIKQLSKRTAIDELDQMLNKATSTRGEVINDLERSLTAEQISELNELLKWVVYSNVSLTVDELEAAMALGSGIESVPWLESAIKTNYSAILKLEDDNVCVQDEVEEFLRKGAVALGLPDTVKDHSSISMTISIKSASREQCGHFFWALADRAFRNQFQFNFEGDSFNTFHALGQHISVDEFEANHFIVTRAFEYFRKDPVEETKAIDIYLLNWLPYHLDRLRVLEDDRKGELSSEQKSEIGLNLQNMFQDDRVLQNHKRTFQKGYWTSEEIKDVRLWLDDPAVVRRMDRKWRADVKTAPSPLRGYFKPIAIAVLEGLLRDRSWEVTNACTWLRQFIALDNSVTPQLDASVNDENDSTNSSPSSSAISDYSIYWNNTNSWCQGFLGLSDSQIDSLWYERLAEATLSEGCGWDVISSFYDRALEQEDPSWLCYRGLGVASHARGRTQDAVAQLGRALDEASKEAACPQPQPTDLAALHLLLGQCCHKTGGMRQAISHYSAAGEVGNSAQLMEGQLGQLRAALALEHAEKTVEVLESIFPTGHTAEKAFGVLKQIAEDLDHESLVLGVFDVAKNNPELLSRIKAAMRAATSNLSPVQDRTIDTIEEADYHIDDEVRGVLLYDQGIAAYQLANSSTTAPSEKAELVDNALMLWRESQEQLSHVGGTVFSSVRLSAISALAKHYFLNMVQKGPDMGQMETLAKMAKDDSMSYLSSNPCSGYLGVLHIQNGNKEKAREALKYQVETAIQILSDDWSENDHLGFYILQSTLSQYHDMENAVVARSLQGQPDLVTSALRFSAKDFPDVTEENKQRMMKLAIKLADETISQSRIHITVGSQQFLRIKAAKSYVESFTSSEYFEREIQSNDDQNSVKSAHCSVDDVEIVHSLIKKRLDALEDQHSSEAYDEDLITITCDGLAFDGKKCQKTADFETEFYQCTYCFRRDFCPDCLKNLRAIGSEASPVCSPTHKWLRCPPQGDDMYVGPEAEIVRVPTSVDVLPEDGQVWVAHYATEGVKTVLVDTWKEQLANHWGIPLSVGENAETETVTSEPVDIGDEGDGSNSGLT